MLCNICAYLLIYTVYASQPKVDPRIVGGSLAPSGFFPYIVALKLNQTHQCGGSIINRRWVLTAAHCVEKPENYEIEYGSNIHGEGTTIGVNKTIIHPYYSNDEIIKNDIALIKVNEQFNFGKEVKIIKLNNEFEPLGMNGVISGWGDSSGWGDYPDRLQMANVTAIECPEKYKNWSHLICVQNQDVAGCYGDSGGPLEIDGLLTGVTSFKAAGVKRSVTCKPNDVAAYTDVRNYLRWIEDSTNM